MTLKQFAQYTVFLFFIINFFRSLYVCIHGRKSHEPLGFKGLVISVVVSAFAFWLWHTAGAFTEIFR